MGNPVRWLNEELAYFDQRGHRRVAAACRDLLRRAGHSALRSSGVDVEASLQALGVSSRKAEVLGLLGEGLANRDIARRLHIPSARWRSTSSISSPRPVRRPGPRSWPGRPATPGWRTRRLRSRVSGKYVCVLIPCRAPGRHPREVGKAGYTDTPGGSDGLRRRRARVRT